MMKSFLLPIITALILSSATCNAQQDDRDNLKIIECNPESQQECATLYNRTCYNYTTNDEVLLQQLQLPQYECVTCLNNFIKFDQLDNDVCYNITELETETQLFSVLSELIELFRPEYADPNVTTEERAGALANTARVISYWRSRIPLVEFNLELNLESTLTDEERIKRLGVNPTLKFDPGNQVNIGRGVMEQFIVEGLNDVVEVDVLDIEEKEDGGVVDVVNQPSRRLSATALNNDNNKKKKEKRVLTAHRRMQDTPPAIDWHALGYTTVVKNQGYCGCCWAVSTAAAVESALMITNQTNKFDAQTSNSLSFQQMISCDKENLACNGGNIFLAASYVWEHNDFANDNYGGLVSYSDYPYEEFLGVGKPSECELAGKTPVAFLNFPKIVTSVNDRYSFEKRRDLIMAAVAQQPVTMTLKSNCDLFMSYSDGVLSHDTGCECGDVNCIDHAVVIVGYNTTHNPPYWKVRNSWGIEWGELGHVRIAMDNSGSGWGLFGMLSETALLGGSVTTKEELPPRPSWWQRSSTGAKVFVLIVAIGGFIILSMCVCGAAKRFRKSSD